MTLPAAHFARWTASDYQPVRIEPDGHIWGHITDSQACMRGGRGCRTVSDGLVGGFHVGSPIRLDDGTEIRTGPMTFGGLHADRGMSYDDVRRLRHEDSSSVVASVIAWPDPPYGIAVTGTLVPGLSDTVRSQLAASGWSGEWWPNPRHNHQLEMIAVHSVPTPALPIAASADCGCDGSCAGEPVAVEVVDDAPEPEPVESDEPSDLQLVVAALDRLSSLIVSERGEKPSDDTVSKPSESDAPNQGADESEPDGKFSALTAHLRSLTANTGDG